MKHVLVTALLFVSPLLYAQENKLTRLLVKRGETYVVGPENALFVDTLILQDKATIQFAPARQGVLETKAAYVGKNCTITSKGGDGEHGTRKNSGADGEKGGSLDITIYFETLGSLVIDTRGGNGGKGYVGRHGSKPKTKTTATTITESNGNTKTVYHATLLSTGSKGEDGTPGGLGGNGGNLTLTYGTNGFIPNFNHNVKPDQEATRLINVLHKAGKAGKAGKDGNSYIGMNEAGTTVITGMPVSKSHQPAQDGQITLVNTN